jgi:hypothetical protein
MSFSLNKQYSYDHVLGREKYIYMHRGASPCFSFFKTMKWHN